MNLICNSSYCETRKLCESNNTVGSYRRCTLYVACASACVLGLFVARMECIRWTSSQTAKAGARSYARFAESSDEHVVKLMFAMTHTHTHTRIHSCPLTMLAEAIAVPYLAANTKSNLIANAFLCACAIICVAARRFSRPTAADKLTTLSAACHSHSQLY